jgi:competence protein ComEC
MRFQGFKNDLPKRSLAFEACVGVLLALLCVYGAFLPRPQKSDGVFDRWRAVIGRQTDDVVDPPGSAWVAGLLLGADDGFSQKWKDAFRRTGTSHLTAVSGYNVGLVIMAAQSFLLRLPFRRGVRLILAAVSIVAFVALTGAPGSVVRAAVMIGAVEAGRYFGRPVKPLRALLLAAMLIGLFSPRSLVADRGFQLSFMAAFGLATIAPAFEASFPRAWPRAPVEWISQTLAASIATAPLIAWMSGAYSLVSLPANVAVAAFIPTLMAGGALLLFVSILSTSLAFVLALITRGLFMLPLALIREMASWRVASVSGFAAFTLLVLVELASILLLLRWRRRASLRYAVYE